MNDKVLKYALLEEDSCSLEQIFSKAGEGLQKISEKHKLALENALLKNKIIEADTNNRYKVTAVGLFIYELDDVTLSLYLYPKYFIDFGRDKDGAAFKIIFRVLDKAVQKGALNTETRDGETSRYALVRAIMSDFYAHGIYVPNINKVALNTSDNIDFQKSIEEVTPFLKRGAHGHYRPYYLDLFTIQSSSDLSAFIAQLHASVIMDIYRKHALVFELLGLPKPSLETHFKVKELASRVLYFIKKARRKDFTLRAKRTLLLLSLYFEDEMQSFRSKSVKGLFSSSFRHVWEEALKVALRDDLGTRIDELRLTGGLDIDTGKTLKEYIPKHEYIIHKDKSGKSLIPDIIVKKGSSFIIYDAKYYSENRLPEGKSVNKQFLYLKAYEKLLLENGIKKIGNAFLLPRIVGKSKGAMENFELDELFREGLKDFAPVYIDRVMFKELFSFEGALPSEIEVITLDAAKVFEAYLRN